MKHIKILYILAGVAFLSSCVCKKKVKQTVQNDTTTIIITEPDMNPDMQNQEIIRDKKALQPAIVYKTKKDYSQYVPVILSKDKSTIVSYPAVTDIYYKGKLAYPTKLADGFWLDNRGINENVAFTDYTYEAYSKLEKTPSTEELFSRILDKDPLEEIVNCGNRSNYPDEVKDLNQLIEKGFPGMKVMKFTFELKSP